MFDHVGVHVAEFERSREFYSVVLPTLGFEKLEDNEAGDSRWLVFGTGLEAPFFVVAFAPDRLVQPVHLAFVAPSRAAVRSFHSAGLGAGGKDNGAPGPRRAQEEYYAAFLYDPDGSNIEAGFRGA